MDVTVKTARWTGMLYLIMFFAAIFSEFFVRSSLIVPGDAAATVNNLLASETLFRTSFISDFIVLFCDLGVAILFYVLLKPVNSTIAMTAMIARLIMVPMRGINLLNNLTALSLVGGSAASDAFTPEQLQTLVQTFLSAYGNGFHLDLVFFALHCLLLGYLLYKSDLFPGILGILMVIAGVFYFIDSFTAILAPASSAVVSQIVMLPNVIAELTLTLWLLIRGVRRVEQPENA